MRHFITEDGHVLDSKTLLPQKISYTFTSNPEEDDIGTQFFILIEETGWVDEKYVCLVTEGVYVHSKYVLRGYFKNNPNRYYSLFCCDYHYRVPAEKMEAHWVYIIEGKEYVTESTYFEVLRN